MLMPTDSGIMRERLALVRADIGSFKARTGELRTEGRLQQGTLRPGFVAPPDQRFLAQRSDDRSPHQMGLHVWVGSSGDRNT